MKIPRFWLLAALAALVAVPGGASSKVPFSVIPSGAPDWSPDGRSLVFEGSRSRDDVLNKRSDVYVVPVDGGVPRRLTRMARETYVEFPSWQPNGHLIAFGMWRGKDKNSLHPIGVGVVSDVGRYHRTLATNYASDYKWSPTGATLALTNSSGNLAVFSVDSGKVQTLQPSIDTSATSRVAWSPEGSQLAFSFAYGGIGVVRVGSGDVRRLTMKGRSPAWSPRGPRIAYIGSNGGLYVIGSDGRNGRRLLDSEVLDEPGLAAPAWSPDGRRISYQLFSNVRSPWPSSLHVMDVDSMHTTRVAEHLLTSAWSPTGRFIAYNAIEHLPASELYVVRPDGTGRRDLGLGAVPVWSPDGSSLASLYGKTFSFADLCVVKATGGRRTCPLSRPATVVYAQAVRAPNRLRITSVSLVPARLRSEKDTVKANVLVRDKRGRLVTNAIVSARVTPAWMTAGPRESRADGIAPLVLVPNSSLQLHGRVRIDLVARRPGDGSRSPATAHRTAWLALGGSR